MDQPSNGAKVCNTGNKLAEIGKSTRFVKGDPRINRNGRPRSFDAIRAIAQQISHEELELKDGRKIMVAEAVLRAWAKSPEPQLQKAFIEYAFGKVPDKLETTGLDKPTLILHYAHERNETPSRN